MNLREGKIGKQETVALTAMTVAVGGMFSYDTRFSYQTSGMPYLASLISLAICLVLFLCLSAAMQRRGKAELHGFLLDSFGKLPGNALSLLLVPIFLYAAAFPLSQFVETFNGVVFPDASAESIMVYPLLVIAALSCFGLEAISRTARVFVWPVAAAFVIAVWVALDGFAVFRLFPLLHSGIPALVLEGWTSAFRFLPALMALLVIGTSQQGFRHTRQAGVLALLIGGGIAAVTQLCVGLSFTHEQLPVTDQPLFQFVTIGRIGANGTRVDQYVYLFWSCAGFLSVAFYVYAAALMLSRALKMRDIRPATLTLTGLTVLISLWLLRADTGLVWLTRFFTDNGAMLLALPLVLAALIAGCKREARG